MNYVERMTKAHDSRPDLFPPGQGMYTDMNIKHDDWCPLLSHPGTLGGRLPYEACEESGCRPDIRFSLGDTNYAVTPNGNVVRVG